mgnify:CR=1 FL=1
MPRAIDRFVLDARTLAVHRGGRVLALDTRAIGASFPIRSEASRPKPMALREVDGRMATGTIAVVDVLGPLSQRADTMCGWFDGYDEIAARTVGALEDPDVAAVMMRVDSPGGDVAGLEEAIRQIVSARDSSGKPIAVWVDELAASAGYWLAAATTSLGVWAPPSAMVGSIGVYCPLVDETKALENEGIAVHLVRDPAGKDAANPADPVHEVALAEATVLVREDAARFYGSIARLRGTSPDAIRALNATVVHATEAHRLGLIDGVSTFDGVLTYLASSVRSNRIAAVKATVTRRSLAMAVKKTKALDAPTDQPPPSTGRARAVEVAASCREMATVAEECATAAESGTADEAILGAQNCLAACDTTTKTLKSFLGMTEDSEPAPPPEPQDAMPAADMAAIESIYRTTGKATLPEAAASVAGIVKAANDAKAQAETREREAALQLAAFEAGERRRLTAELVKSGAEMPSTAWEKDANGAPDASKPAAHLAAMSVEQLKARVAAFASRGVAAAVQPPAATDFEIPPRVLEGFQAKGITGDKLTAAIAQYKRATVRAPLARKGN